MLQKINQFVVNCSHSWWKFLLLLIGQMTTIGILINITKGFPALTAGHEPFDMQNSLTAPEIFTQLEGYTEKAFEQYAIFQAVDYLFPLFAGLVLATAGAFALRHAWPTFYVRAMQLKLLLLFLLPTIFDWLENINLLWAIISWPDRAELAANLAVAAKMGKLASMNIVFATVGLLLIWAALRWVKTRFTSQDSD